MPDRTKFFADPIPTAAVVRSELARATVEVTLLRRLLRLAIRREKEAARLQMSEVQGGPGNAA
jgi:hypothetical protein